MAEDLLERFLFDKAPIRGEYIHLHKSYQTIIGQHVYPQALRHLLGEALCVAGLLSAIIKYDGRVTVQFRGKGKLKFLLAQCNNHFDLRGLAQWEGDITYAELMESFQDGVLVILLDSEKNRYQGIVNFKNSLAESIEGYFRNSEQLQTKIWLHVNETDASGLLLQIIPAADRDATAIESEIIKPNWDRIVRLTEKINTQDMIAMGYQELLLKLYPEEDVRIFDPTPVKFKCNCSRKRGENAILVLGKEEAEAELKDKQTMIVTCDFCNKSYEYDRVDVAKIFAEDENPPKDTQLH